MENEDLKYYATAKSNSETGYWLDADSLKDARSKAVSLSGGVANSIPYVGIDRGQGIEDLSCRRGQRWITMLDICI